MAVQERQQRFTYADFAHTAPDTPAGRYLRRFWHPVYLASELPAGRATWVRILSEDFTLYRGASGTPYLVGFRCAHRNTQLNTAWVEDDCVRCFFHGWKYDGSGQCTEQPLEDASFAAKVRIPAYPTVEYLGLIFAYLGDGEPPPMPRYAEWEGDDGLLDVTAYARDCNYFYNVENNVDVTHEEFTHRVSGYTDFGLSGLPTLTGEETEWGITCSETRPDGGVRVTQHGMPNIIQLKFFPEDGESGWRDLISWRVPVDDTHHRAFLVLKVRVTGEAAQRYRERQAERRAKLAQLPPADEVARKILRSELTLDDIRDRPDLIFIQDHVTQIGMGSLADRANDRLGRSDVLVILLRDIFAREMQAMLEGRPLKQWQRTASQISTTGV